MKLQTIDSRRQFLWDVATAAGGAMLLRPLLGAAADRMDARVAEIVKKTMGVDTHNHVDVPLSDAEMPGPDIDLAGEMKRSGLSAICMTFATDYQPGDAYDRFLKGLASMDRQLERNRMKRALMLRTSAPLIRRPAYGHSGGGGGHFCKAMLSGWKKLTGGVCGTSGCCTIAMPLCRWVMSTPTLRAMAD